MLLSKDDTEMGNVCTHQENDRTTYLESMVEEQEIRIEELLQKHRLLERENEYYRRRIRNMTVHQSGNERGASHEREP